MSFADASRLLPRFEAAMGVARAKAERLVQEAPGLLPIWTHGGTWQFAGDEPGDAWCKGFLPGLLWLIHEATGEAGWRRQAEQYSRSIESHRTRGDLPGLGFLFYHGAHRRWYETTIRDGRPSDSLREIVFEAARTLAGRFQSSGGYLPSIAGPETLSIETLMDIPLVLYAAVQLGDDDLLQLASQHCATTRRHLVRGDGSVAAEARFDPATGECLGPLVGPGYRGDSCWSRGVAWAIHGFAEAGSIVNFGPWLQTARLCAHYAIERLAGEAVPPWDFDAPGDVAAASSSRAAHEDGGPDAHAPTRDTSAAAVTAAGLLTLANAEQTIGAEEARQRRHLQEMALRILDTLCEPEYLAAAADAWPGIIKGGVGNLPAGVAVGESVIWGDFFFVEALQLAIPVLRSSLR